LNAVGQHGVSLIELAIALAVLSLALGLGAPSLAAYLANQQIRSRAQNVLSALQQAREEAVRRNAIVRFSLVSTVTNACALRSAGPHIVLSRDNPAGQCGGAVSESTAPYIVKVIASDGAARRISVAAHDGDGNPRYGVAFDGLGRVVSSGNDWISEIDFDASAAADRRRLRVQVFAGGDIRLCDPAVSDATDPRKCQP
jgi:type IV fimbrial biogenesis protein FimT